MSPGLESRAGSVSQHRPAQSRRSPQRSLPLNAESCALAEVLAGWIGPAPAVPAVYLFGSRVRGDRRPDSDVDVRLLGRTKRGGFCRREIVPARPAGDPQRNNLTRPTRRSAEVSKIR